VTICELYIETHWNSIRSQIPRTYKTSDIPLLVSDRIPTCDSCVEKNIRPVKKGFKTIFREKISHGFRGRLRFAKDI